MATAPVEVAAAEIALSESRIVLGSPGDRHPPGAGAGAGEPDDPGRDPVAARPTPPSSGWVRPGSSAGSRPGGRRSSAIGFGQERRVAVLVHREPSTLVVTPRPTAGAIQLPVRAAPPGHRRRRGGRIRPRSPRRGSRGRSGDTAIIAYDPAKGELTGRALGTTTLTARAPRLRPGRVDGPGDSRHPRPGPPTGGDRPGRARLAPRQPARRGRRAARPASDLEWSSEPRRRSAGLAGRHHRRTPPRPGGRHGRGAVGKERDRRSVRGGGPVSGVQPRRRVRHLPDPKRRSRYHEAGPRRFASTTSSRPCPPTAPGSSSAPIAAEATTST